VGKDYTVNHSATQRDPFIVRHSFVVRVWREEGHAGWRGWVQHTRSGDAASFQELDDLLAFVQHRTGTWDGAARRRLE
jgi:hypothetical protein